MSLVGRASKDQSCLVTFVLNLKVQGVSKEILGRNVDRKPSNTTSEVRMSHGYNATGASEYDAGANENPYAVWIRNVPTWLDEDRFVEMKLS